LSLKTKNEPKIAGIIRLTNHIKAVEAIMAISCWVMKPKK
jgi:hypothetical protein